MRWTSRVCAVLGLAALSAGAHAAILVQQGNGDVLIVSTTANSSGIVEAALYRDLNDVSPSGSTDAFSPNALGYNGSAIRTSCCTTSAQLYRDNTLLLSNLPDSNGTGVAAGDVGGDAYYYLDSTFTLHRVTGVNGAAGTQAVTTIGDLSTSPGDFGDMAINGNVAYASYGGSSLARFNLDGTGFTVLTGTTQRYLGLAFEGGVLYGVNADGSGVDRLYRLLVSGTTITEQLVGIIKLNGADVVLTDAASVPLPASAWLLLTGLIGFGALGRRRRTAAEAV